LTSPIKFDALRLSNWRQFEKVNIDFNDQVTILTGQNGSGKTSIVSLLAQNFRFQWPTKFVATPELNEAGQMFYSSATKSADPLSGGRNDLGALTFKGSSLVNANAGFISTLYSVEAEYRLQVNTTVQINGLYIPAHRPKFRYRTIGQTKLGLQNSSGAAINYHNAYQKEFSLPDSTLVQVSSNSVIKESLISWAIFGYGNAVMPANKQLADLFEGFQKILGQLLPEHLGFLKLEIRNPEVVVVTNKGAFSLDAVSGGIGSIIELGWQLFVNSFSNELSVVVIDEPENHLHPELQQEVLPKLLAAFPKLQFIVATHSPLIVTSVKNASVYVLLINSESGKVQSKLLETNSTSGTANETLRDVLGLPFTMPKWAVAQLQEIVEKYCQKPFSSETFKYLRAELNDKGLQDYAPTAIADLVHKLHQKEQ
jgi:predicted ATPase